MTRFNLQKIEVDIYKIPCALNIVTYVSCSSNSQIPRKDSQSKLINIYKKKQLVHEKTVKFASFYANNLKTNKSKIESQFK